LARKLAKALVAKFEQFKEVPALRPFAKYLAHPALWGLNRRSVALAVAAGLFSGLIPGPLQILGAAFLAVYFKFNFPIAVVVTLYTNPLTIVPLYLAAYQLGAFALNAPPLAALPPSPSFNVMHPFDGALAYAKWMTDLGEPLLLGVPLLALSLSLAGYLLVRVLWSAYLRLAWRRRKNKRFAEARK
jgi:uncharacterized protein